MQVIVTSAVELSADQKKAIKSAVEKKHGKVELLTQLDPHVIGGIKIRVGTSTYDSTIRTKLDKLRQHLTNQLA